MQRISHSHLNRLNNTEKNNNTTDTAAETASNKLSADTSDSQAPVSRAQNRASSMRSSASASPKRNSSSGEVRRATGMRSQNNASRQQTPAQANSRQTDLNSRLTPGSSSSARSAGGINSDSSYSGQTHTTQSSQRRPSAGQAPSQRRSLSGQAARGGSHAGAPHSRSASRGTSSGRPPYASSQRRPSGNKSSKRRSSINLPGRSSGGKRRSGFSGFKKGIIIYSAILLVILIVGMIIFSSFIGNYEKNQPSNIAKTVSAQLSENPEAFLKDHSDMISSMSDTDEVINKFVQSISGKKLSYIENSDYRAEAPSFDIRADGATAGKITLESAGKGAFGLSTWKLASLDIASFLPDTYSYTILAPSRYKVFINGNELPESAITAKDETPELLANAVKFIKEAPKYDSYTATGLLSIPEVTSQDESGKDVGVAAAQEYFVAGGEPSKEFIAERKDFVENALRSWAYHFINYNNGQAPLTNFVQTGSDLYSYIFGSETMDPIYTGFYDWEYITNVEFTEFEAKNYIQYADDCFSVDVKYRLKVDFSNSSLSDDGQMLDATWVIVHNNGYWGICDVIYHQGSESSLADAVNQNSSGNNDDAKKADSADEAAADNSDDEAVTEGNGSDDEAATEADADEEAATEAETDEEV